MGGTHRPLQRATECCTERACQNELRDFSGAESRGRLAYFAAMRGRLSYFALNGFSVCGLLSGEAHRFNGEPDLGNRAWI